MLTVTYSVIPVHTLPIDFWPTASRFGNIITNNVRLILRRVEELLVGTQIPGGKGRTNLTEHCTVSSDFGTIQITAHLISLNDNRS